MTRLLISIITLLCLSCSQGSKDNLKRSPSLDLIALEEAGLLDNTEVVIVVEDPVYHKTKSYNAVPLLPLLQKYTFLDSLDTTKMKVVFECEDGYKPEMSLEKLLQSDAFVAISDIDAPKGRKWERIVKDGTEMKAAPFYIVYKNVSAKDYSYKWPYNLVKIHLEPRTTAEIPTSSNHEAGRTLYIQHCKVCHALNGIGGDMGPELNIPMNVTEYWKEEHLIAFIQNPQAYRTGIKMPNLGVSKTESVQIVNYLKSLSHPTEAI